MSKTWHEVSARAGRNDMPYLLATNFEDMEREEMAKGLEDAWTSAEWPVGSLTAEVWVYLFNMVLEGDECLLHEECSAVLAALVEHHDLEGV